MVTLIASLLTSLISLLISAIAGVLELFSITFVKLFGFNFQSFFTYFPLGVSLINFIKQLALGWLLITIVFFVIKGFGMAIGLRIERNQIWSFLVRFMVLGFLSFYAIQLTSVIFIGLGGDGILGASSSAGGIFGNILGADEIQLDVTGLKDSLALQVAGEEFLMTSGSMVEGGGAFISIIVMIVALVIVTVDFFKLIAEYVERYIKLIFYIILSPLAFVMGILEETRAIFSYFWRTYIADLFVYLMIAFLIKGFILVINASSQSLTGGIMVDENYGNLAWAFFAMAYGKVALRFENLVMSLGVNASRSSGSGGGVMGAIGLSAMALRSAFKGKGSKGGSGGGFFSNLKGNMARNVRAGIANSDNPMSAVGNAGLGAIRGIAESTPIGKALNMSRSGESSASSLNDKFAEMKAAAGRDMSMKEYDALRDRADKSGLSLDQQAEREGILADIKDKKISSQMGNNMLANKGLLLPEEQSPTEFTGSSDAVGGGGLTAEEGAVSNPSASEGLFSEVASTTDTGGMTMSEESRSMADAYSVDGHLSNPNTGKPSDYNVPTESDGTVKLDNGAVLQPNKALVMPDGVKHDKDGTHYPNGTHLNKNGEFQTGTKGLYVDKKGVVHHPSGEMTKGNQVIDKNGNTVKTLKNGEKIGKATFSAPPKGSKGGGIMATTAPDGSKLKINSSGDISHANGIDTTSGATVHADSSISTSDGSVLYGTDNGMVSHGNGATTFNDGTTSFANGTKVFPDSSISHGGVGVTTSAGKTSFSDGSSVSADGVMAHSNGDISYANDYKDSKTGVVYSAGSVRHSDGAITNGNGGISHDNGNTYSPIADSYKHSNGTLSHSSGKVTHSTGSVTDNKSISHSSGATITGKSITMPNKNVIARDSSGGSHVTIDKGSSSGGVLSGKTLTVGETTKVVNAGKGTTRIEHSDDYHSELRTKTAPKGTVEGRSRYLGSRGKFLKSDLSKRVFGSFKED